jgi:hydroxyethylthiazole kinase-like uncharacterized protein yjeF
MSTGCGFLSENQRRPVTASEMRDIEDRAARTGISKLLMMENAGSAIARFIAHLIANAPKHSDPVTGKNLVLLVAGTGNNGGDAFVAARHLSYWRHLFDTTLVLIGSGADVRAEEALYNWQILKKITYPRIIEVDSEDKLTLLQDQLGKASIAVVALFGTGFKGTPRPLQSSVIDKINSNSVATKISVDIPSGMEADSGEFAHVIYSDYTITMYSAKVGMLKDQTTKQICGKILIANIGIPDERF